MHFQSQFCQFFNDHKMQTEISEFTEQNNVDALFHNYCNLCIYVI